MHSGRADGSVLQDQRGIILPLILVFLALGLLLIVPTLGQGYSALAGTGVTEAKAKELHAADAGIEAGIFNLLYEDGAGLHGRIEDVNDCEVDVTITDTGELESGLPVYHIQSIAKLREDSSTTINAYVYFAMVSIHDAFDTLPEAYIEDGKIAGNKTIDGEYVLYEDIDAVEGTVLLDGTLVFYGYVEKFSGNAESSGTVIFCGGLGTFTGSAEAGFTLITFGDLTIEGGANTRFDGDTIVFGNITLEGTPRINGTLCYPAEYELHYTNPNQQDYVNQDGISHECGEYSDYCGSSVVPKILTYEIE